MTSTVSRMACDRAAAVDPDLRRERVPPRADPEHDPPGREVVERREGRREQADVARPVVHDARADPDPLGDGRERGHRDGRLADEAALGLPDGLEAALLGELRVAHAVADRVLVLEVERYSVVELATAIAGLLSARTGAAGSRSSRVHSRSASAARGRGELLLVDARQPAVEHDPLARDHHVANVARAEAEDPVAGEARLAWSGAGAA